MASRYTTTFLGAEGLATRQGAFFDSPCRSERGAPQPPSGPFRNLVDPVGEDLGAIRRYSALLVQSIEALQSIDAKQP
jgi:hypothetical protein